MKQVVFDSNFQWQGNFTKSNDYVGEGVGGNYGKNEQGSAWEIFNFSNALKLFGDDSPHSTYKCTSNDNAKCGGGFMKYILVFLLALNCMGCGSKQIMLAGETFENPYMSFKTPAMGWYNYDPKWRKAWDNNGYHISILHEVPTNGSLEVRVMDIPTDDDNYFNSDLDFENLYIQLKNSPRSVKMIRQQGISLYEYQTQYFQGIRCVGSVSSRSYGGVLYSASSKNYGLNCGYYHKTAGKRMLRLGYRYYGAVGDSQLERDGHISQDNLPTLNEAEAVLKRDVNELLNSVQLKDVDWERMEKEGLIHNKPFRTITW